MGKGSFSNFGLVEPQRKGNKLNREINIGKLKSLEVFDMIIIGGGATGLGTALDASHRGLKVVLLEKYDFGKGTSSKSTKLLHGGVRYLAQGNIGLVLDALRERGHVIKNAPHLTGVTTFVIPAYSWLEKMYYLAGLKIYDFLSGKMSIGKTQSISKEEVGNLLPDIETKRLYGGIVYKDGSFDDARLAITLAKSADMKGAIVLNYFNAMEFELNHPEYKTVIAYDKINQNEIRVNAKVIINATGVFAEEMIRSVPLLKNKIKISPAQGIHLVVDQKHFSGQHALMIPRTTDGRVLFAVPWYNKVIIGTTDTPLQKIEIEPQARDKEVKFILHTFNKYAKKKITKKEITAVYAGIRPLVSQAGIKQTAKLNRDHTIADHRNGIISITGGKWTTYRLMAEQVVKQAVKKYGLKANEKDTKNLQLEGYTCLDQSERLKVYGCNAADIEHLESLNQAYKVQIHPSYPFTKAQLIYAVNHEMAEKPEDFLARRTRLLFLDVKASMDCIQRVAEWMAEMKGRDSEWVKREIDDFKKLASLYSTK